MISLLLELRAQSCIMSDGECSDASHPSSCGVGRPRQPLQSHLVLKGRGGDDLGRRHAGHTLHGFVFGCLVLSEDNNMRNIRNVYPIKLKVMCIIMYFMATNYY